MFATKKKLSRGDGGNTSPVKNYAFTSWKDEPKYYEKYLDYLAYRQEMCPNTKRLHWQGFVVFKTKVSVKSATAWIKNNICYDVGTHVTRITGNLLQNDIYCSKEGLENFIEHGECPKPGARTDLYKLRDEIMAGRSVKSIRQEMDPKIFHMYGRTLNELENDRVEDMERDFKTEGIWIWGPTGCGKSRKARALAKGKKYMWWSDDKGWWDKYKQQEIVIMDDYRGEIKFNMLLKLLDEYPIDVSRRGKAPLAFMSKFIIITSCKSPEQVYRRRDNEDIQQLYRRITVEEMKYEEHGDEDQTEVDSDCDEALADLE